QPSSGNSGGSRRGFWLCCFFLPHDIFVERVNICGGGEEECQHLHILHLLEYQAYGRGEEQPVRRTHKQIAVIIANHMDQVSRRQRDHRANGVAGSSAFDQRIVDSLADLCCISVTQNQGTQRERLFVFRRSQASTDALQTMRRVFRECAYRLDPCGLIVVWPQGKMGSEPVDNIGSAIPPFHSI